jgi:hypothetical protein
MTDLSKQKLKMRLLEVLDDFINSEIEHYDFQYFTENMSLHMAQSAFAVIEQSIDAKKEDETI